MSLTINDTAPDFDAQTTEGEINFHEWIGDSWAVLFSHPKDFTPVCTTELGYMAKIQAQFERRNVKVIGLSVDATNDHEVLRVIDSLQLTAKHRVATPVNWKQGDDVIIAGSVSNDEAKQIFGDWKQPKPYIRIVPQPS